jgi:hypothetical protein
LGLLILFRLCPPLSSPLPGEIATVRIERTDEYDLHGTVVGF